MKNNIFTLIILLSLFACDKECYNEQLNYTSLETEYTCENTAMGLKIDLENNFTIIQNQTTYSQMVEGCDVSIDFEKYDLIIGTYNLASGLQSISYDYNYNCENKMNVLRVNISTNLLTVAPKVTYHALVDKIESGTQVQVEVRVSQS